MARKRKETINAQRTSIPLIDIFVHNFDIYGNLIVKQKEFTKEDKNGNKVTKVYNEPDWWIYNYPYSYRQYIKSNFIRLQHVDSAVKFDTLKFTFGDPEFIFVQRAGEIPISVPKEQFKQRVAPLEFINAKNYQTPMNQVSMKHNISPSTLTSDQRYELLDLIAGDVLLWDSPEGTVYKDVYHDALGIGVPESNNTYQGSRISLLVAYPPSKNKNVSMYGKTSSTGLGEVILFFETEQGDSGWVWSRLNKFEIDPRLYASLDVPLKANSDLIATKLVDYEEHRFSMFKDKRKRAFGINIAWINKGALWTIGYGNNSYNLFAPSRQESKKMNYKEDKYTGHIDRIEMSFPESGIPEISIIFVEALYMLRDVNVSRYRKYQYFIQNEHDPLNTDYTAKDVKTERDSYNYENLKETTRQLALLDSGASKAFAKSLDVLFINRTFLEIVEEVCSMFNLDFYNLGGGLFNDILNYFGTMVTVYKDDKKNKDRIRRMKHDDQADLESSDLKLLYENKYITKDEYNRENSLKSPTNPDNSGLLQKKFRLQKLPLVIWRGSESAWDFLHKNILNPLNIELVQIGVNRSEYKGRITLKHFMDPEAVALVGHYLRVLDILVNLKSKIAKSYKPKGVLRNVGTKIANNKNKVINFFVRTAGTVIGTPTLAGWGEDVYAADLIAGAEQLGRVDAYEDIIRGLRKDAGEVAVELEDVLERLRKASVDIGDFSKARSARVITYDPSNTDKYEASTTAASITMNREALSEDYANIANTTNEKDNSKVIRELVSKAAKLEDEGGRETRYFDKTTKQYTKKIKHEQKKPLRAK
jgi:hypothetical protein